MSTFAGMSRWTHLVAIAFVAVAASGCVGAIDRADFDEEVRRRGGGISAAWVDESLTAAAEALSITSPDDLEFLTLTINGTSRSLTINARRGDRPDFIDSVTVREGEVVAVTPIQDADELPLAALLVDVDETPIDDVETLVDRALAEFDEPDSFVTVISVSLDGTDASTTVQLSSARRTGSVVFDAAGNTVEVDR